MKRTWVKVGQLTYRDDHPGGTTHGIDYIYDRIRWTANGSRVTLEDPEPVMIPKQSWTREEIEAFGSQWSSDSDYRDAIDRLLRMTEKASPAEATR